MNKLIFLTGLLTALLFIGTAHGGPYNEETIDEEDNEMASVEQAAIVVALVKKLGCVAAKKYCGLQDIMMAKKQGWIRSVVRKVGNFFRKVRDAIKGIVTKGNFCKAVGIAC